MEVDPAAVDPAEFVKAIREAPDDQLAVGMADEQVRSAVLDGIFSQWAEHFDAARAGDTDAVLEWKIFDKPGGGYDRYQVVIKDGKCTVDKDGGHEPRVTFKLKPVDFLKLVTGNAGGPMMFMTGKLKIDGDLMFAATVQSLFRMPESG